jgi:GNAT superfamily N-acetyltransferase
VAKLRQAGPDDAAGLAEIFLAARAEMTYLPRLHTDEETCRWIAEVVLVEQMVQVAEVEEALVGFAALAQNHLGHLYVAPGRQGGGVGRALLDWVKTICPGGFDLWVFQKNRRARSFYRREGLRESLLTDGADNEERQPDVLMTWQR